MHQYHELMKTTKTRGGSRKGAGAKLKYGKQTVSFRVPLSKAEGIKKIVHEILHS